MKARLIQTSWIVVFFLQAIRVIFSTMFGVIYDQIFEGPMSLWLPISNILVILALLAPGLLARKSSSKWMATMGAVALIVRVPLSVDDATLRYWCALVLLAAGGSYLWMAFKRSREEFAAALLWGSCIEYLLRVLGGTFDLSLHDGSLPFVAAGVLALLGTSRWLHRASDEPGSTEGGISWTMGFGLGAFLFLEMTLLALPSAVARYSGVAYAGAAVLLFGATALPLIPGTMRALGPILGLKAGRPLFVLVAAFGFLGGYFQTGWLAAGGLILGQLLIVSAVMHAIIHGDAGARGTGWRFSIGLIWMLVLNFVSAFAFTYPYTLPMMRDKGWIVHLLAMLTLGWWMLGPIPREKATQSGHSRPQALLVALATLAIVISVWPRAPRPLPDGAIRLATWNIHYGYDDDWHTNLQEMAAVIEAEGVDVIAMQEVDTGRMTSYSSDNAYFLARRLGMQVVYLPAVEHLTGIALLYKGSPAPSEVHLLTSIQEQTGIVRARLGWGSSGLEVFGIWMGLSDEDTMRQINEALDYIGPAAPASFGGDFNARPDDPEIQAVRAAGFADPFDLLGVSDPKPTSPAINPQSRIDFVWLRGLIPLKAWVADSLASDHRMVVVEVVQP